MTQPDTIAHYKIVAKLGEGGMGAVYRATDKKLNRDVAIKVLPPAFAEDAGRMQRFEREAQVLASLNHPNIAAIYGIEENAIVMELVEGAELAGPVPIDTALEYARQIAAALEAAHERGIIHRDLKPANVKVTPEGVVKVLDFGLAKSSDPNPSSNSAMSPTLTIRATEAGMIMGTAGYMSPEQAAGKPVDKRADIWSFGVVLYELLAGGRMFEGETVSHTLADVLRAPIDFSRLPKDTPPAIRGLLSRCLDRRVRDRLRDIGEARVTIQQYLANPAAAVAETPPTVAARPPRIPWTVAAIAGVAALASGFVAWRHLQEDAPRAVRLSFPAPNDGSFSGLRGGLAISPDGRRIAFLGTVEGKLGLWVRDLESPAARMLLAPGERAGSLFWSPDSRFLGFFASGKLNKIDAAGGPAIPICDSANVMGAAWSRDDAILFAPGNGGILRVPAAGGTPVPVTEIDRTHGEDSHRFPWFLPDGRHFLYTARLGDRAKSLVYAADLASKSRSPVLNVPTNVQYVSPGYLLFVANGTLMAQPFDPASLRTRQGAVPLAEHLGYLANSASGSFTASQTGVVAYTSSELQSAQLTWLDRSGKVLGTVGPPGDLEMISLSPDGSAVVAVRVDAQTGNADLWLHHLERHTDSRLTFAGSNRYPVWSPGGTHIAYSSARNGGSKVYRKPGDGAGQEELLDDAPRLPMDWSRDGRYLITATGLTNPITGNDIWVLPLFGDRKPFPYLQTVFAEYFPRLSPDGRWMAYTSNESNQDEVYVSGFPRPEGKWLVSIKGGSRPVWSPDGKELYYWSADGKMMAVEVKAGAGFQSGLPKPLFSVRLPPGNTTFEVTRDGRFLIPVVHEPASVPMSVILNWPAMLKK